MTKASRRICDLMYELRDDLYREVRGRDGGYAMVNPPGNVRVDFRALDDETVWARVQVSRGDETIRSAETSDADFAWIEREVP